MVITEAKVWLPGRLQNLKANRAHWSSAIAYKRRWREAVFLGFRLHPPPIRTPSIPKRVLLVAYVWNRFDAHDGLRAACSPIIDGLRDAGVIHNDDSQSGHVFDFAQRVVRERRGVWVTVELLDDVRERLRL